jgi:hypothetical protein
MFMRFEVSTPTSANSFLVRCNVMHSDRFGPNFQKNMLSPYNILPWFVCCIFNISCFFLQNKCSISVTKQVGMCKYSITIMASLLGSLKSPQNSQDLRKSSVYFTSSPVYWCSTCSKVGRDSSVGIATDYRLDGPRIESRWGTRFSAPVQTGPRAHPASCTMGIGSFPGVKSGRVVTLTPHHFLVPRS